MAVAKLARLFDGPLGFVLDDVHDGRVAAGAGNLTASKLGHAARSYELRATAAGAGVAIRDAIATLGLSSSRIMSSSASYVQVKIYCDRN